MSGCGVFWGTHGCDLQEEHGLVHRCGAEGDWCSEMRQVDAQGHARVERGMTWIEGVGEVRYWHEGEWGAWMGAEWFTLGEKVRDEG